MSSRAPPVVYLSSAQSMNIITNDLSDVANIQREMRNMFVRTNILIRRFGKCSMNVKAMLFKAYCLGVYDIALWKVFTQESIN